MSLKNCIEITANLDDADVESVLESFDSYKDSMSQDEAARLAIDDVLASVEQERKEYLQLFNETFPTVLKEAGQQPDLTPIPKPKPIPAEKTEEVLAEKAGKQLESRLKSKYKLEKISISERKDSVILNMVNVSEAERKKGVGTIVMQEIVDYSNSKGKRIELTPDLIEGTTSKQRLVKFYKRFGFVENKGKNKNFEVSESMYREPTKVVAQKPKSTAEDIAKKSADARKDFYSKRPANIGMDGKLLETGDFVQRDDPISKKPKKSVSVESLTKLVKNIQTNNQGTRAITFHIRSTQEEAFGINSVTENGIIRGGFYSGTNEIVLIAENITDINDAMAVIRHEVVGHYGLRQLLNEDGSFDKLLDRVYEARSGELKAQYDWVAKAYPELVKQNDVRKIADEMLAHAAETKTESNLLTKIYDAIIKLLNKLGLMLDTISHKEVNALIRLSEANLRKEIRPQVYQQTEVSYRADYIAPDTAAMEGQPLFAKQLDLLSPKGVPAETVRTQTTDNFNIKYKQVEVGTLNTGLDTVSSAEEAAHVLAPIRKHAQETMMALVLDKNNKVLHVIRHTKGVKDGANVSPVELGAAIGATDKAASVWFAHNHPTGISTPSSADIQITKRLYDALDGSGVSVKGHVILGKGKRAHALDRSGEELGSIEVKPMPRKRTVPVTERMIRKRKMERAYQISDSSSAKEFIRNEATKNGVLLLDNKHAVIGILTMSQEEMISLRATKQVPRILKALDQTNAAAVIVVSDSVDAADNLNTYFQKLEGLRLLDSFIREGVSIYSQVEAGEDLGSRGNVFFSKSQPAHDVNDPNVVFSRAADDAANSPVGQSLGMPEEGRKDLFVRLAQDSFNRVKKMQETIIAKGGKIELKADVYLAEERSSSKISYGLKEFDKKYQKPFIKILDKKDLTIEEVDLYLIAKHAQERNEYIAGINDEMQDGGSGMTTQQANEILLEMESKKTDLEAAAKIVYEANNQTLDLLVKEGHMKQDVVDELRERWDYYVPLKGKDGEDYRMGTGVGYNITGSQFKHPMGRGEGNLPESPTAHSFAQSETAIVRTGKAKVGQALVELVRANPDPEFWSIGQRTYKQFEDLYGTPFEGYEIAPPEMVNNIDYKKVMGITIEERIKAKAEGRKKKKKTVYKLDRNYKHRPDVFGVMVEGEEILIKIEDRIVMEQLLKANTTQLNAIIRGFGQVNRYLAMVYTGLYPEFVLGNFQRDIQTAGIHLAGEHSAKLMYKAIKEVPSAMRGIWQGVFDTKGQSEMRDLWDEMQKEGGAIGFFGLEDIDTKVRHLHNKLKRKRGVWGATKRGVIVVRDLTLDANLAVENGVRLAAYKVIKEELMANGAPKAEAIAKAGSVAKNLTVNFNRKGEWAPVFNSLWLFSSVTIQGSARIISSISKHKGTRRIVAGIATFGFLNALYNSGAGDDDDGIPYWEKVSDYEKQTNIIFMHPDGDYEVGIGGGGKYFKYRMPYGYNVFHYTGLATHDAMFNPRATSSKTAMNMLTAVLNGYNPIQGADLLDSLTPTIVKPYEQDARNINFMGGNVRPEYIFDQYDRPSSQKFFGSTNELFKDTFISLNELTGGDETHPGWWDWSPETVKHYTRWLTGGAGMFATRVTSLGVKLATDEEIETRDIPFIRSMVGQPGSRFDSERYYEALKQVAAVKAQLKIHKGTDKWSEYREENYQVYSLSFKALTVKNEIRQKMMSFSMKYDDAIEAQ